jgi:hypothetical protein
MALVTGAAGVWGAGGVEEEGGAGVVVGEEEEGEEPAVGAGGVVEGDAGVEGDVPEGAA